MFILDKKKYRGKYILIQLHVTVNNVDYNWIPNCE